MSQQKRTRSIRDAQDDNPSAVNAPPRSKKKAVPNNIVVDGILLASMNEDDLNKMLASVKGVRELPAETRYSALMDDIVRPMATFMEPSEDLEEDENDFLYRFHILDNGVVIPSGTIDTECLSKILMQGVESKRREAKTRVKEGVSKSPSKTGETGTPIPDHRSDTEPLGHKNGHQTVPKPGHNNNIKIGMKTHPHTPIDDESSVSESPIRHSKKKSKRIKESTEDEITPSRPKMSSNRVN